MDGKNARYSTTDELDCVQSKFFWGEGMVDEEGH